MVPALPFMYLTIAVAMQKFKQKVAITLLFTLFFISTAYALLFFYIVYPTDSRIAANSFSRRYVEGQSATVEPYDLGALVFMQTFSDQKIINMYEIDQNIFEEKNLTTSLNLREIFLSPSQRLFRSRLKNSSDFPVGNTIYKKLFDGSLGFRVIYQTPCTLLCRILYNGDPFYNVEETATVFDHPFVTIFKKI